MHAMKFKTVISIGALLAGLIIGTNASADDEPYTLKNSPWQDKEGTFCAPMAGTGLRAYIFTATYATGTPPNPIYESSELILMPGYARADGTRVTNYVQERHVPFLIKTQSYRYIKNQSVGYLNRSNEWVNKNATPVTKFEDFRSIHWDNELNGTRIEKNTAAMTKDKTIIAARQNRMQHAQACTFMRVKAFHQRYTDLYPSNYKRLNCTSDGKVFEKILPYPVSYDRRSKKIRDVQYFYVDGDGRYGSGDIHAFAKADKQNSQGEYCDWKEIRE